MKRLKSDLQIDGNTLTFAKNQSLNAQKLSFKSFVKIPKQAKPTFTSHTTNFIREKDPLGSIGDTFPNLAHFISYYSKIAFLMRANFLIIPVVYPVVKS